MTNDEKLEDKYVEKIVSMGYTEENARDYIESKKPKSVVIDPNLGLDDTERNEVKLPEVKESVFASSSNILLPSQRNVNPYARGLAVLLLIGCVNDALRGPIKVNQSIPIPIEDLILFVSFRLES